MVISQSQIRQLLTSEDQIFRDVGFREVIRRIAANPALAIYSLRWADQPAADGMIQALLRQFPFLRQTYASPRISGRAAFTNFDFLRREMESFLVGVRNTLASLEPSALDVLCCRLAKLPGIAAYFGPNRTLISVQTER